MSVEEDTELRDLLAQVLENNGSLAKIRAQLRACVFFAFSEDELIQKKQPLLNPRIKNQIATPEGKLMFCLVREFLEYFDLDYTISVYEPESYLGSEYFYTGRNKIIEDLKLDVNETVPLLVQLIKIAQDYNSAGKIKCKNATNIEEAVDISNNEVVENNSPTEIRLNQTFDVSSPNVEQNEDKIETPRSTNSVESKDDTYEGTSSIAEDSVKEKCLIDLEKSVKVNNSHAQVDSPRSLLDMSINDFSPPILKEKIDKHKLSPQKQEKLKSKSSLTSLADLPPLQLNKSRNNETMLLPSLYSNDFKDKNREIEKLFENDSLDNYEEDFMSSSDLDLKSEKSIANETRTLIKTSTEKNNGNDKLDVPENFIREKPDSAASSVTSDDFELNSNLDDILKSNNSN